jgi:tetratricopeptide (TPR) repeat protein
VIEIKPKHPGSYYQLCQVYYFQGLLDKAIKTLNRVTQLNCNINSMMWNSLGFLYLMKNKLKEAQTHLRRSLQTKGDHFRPHFNLALVYVLRSKNKTKEAKKLLRKSLSECKGQNNQEKLYIALGTIALGDIELGLQTLEELLNTLKNPNQPGVIRGGVLEAAEILARRPEQFPGIDRALTLLKTALQKQRTSSKSSIKM